MADQFDLKATGTYGTQRVTSQKPMRRPVGLLAMQ